jgi:hypothetical protein
MIQISVEVSLHKQTSAFNGEQMMGWINLHRVELQKYFQQGISWLMHERGTRRGIG